VVRHAHHERVSARTSTDYNATVPPSPAPLARAYAACEALARSHYENFPVASRLLPSEMRPHVAAIYAFARVADDVADEGALPGVERRTQLDAWRRRLHAAVITERPPEASADRDDLIVVALAHTIQACHLPIGLFDDLLSAFEQDTMTTRYASWAEVFDYCRRSANPIGRLVLRVAGRHDDDADRSSDALCTALQLTNFWQDFGRDWRAGRIYVPREVQQRCGAAEEDLTAASLSDAWAHAIDECVRVTRERYEAGRAVCDRVTGRLRYELRCTWLGGRRILDRTARARQRLLSYRPTLGLADLPGIAWGAARWPHA
jgi:hydroxysqualene synthase